MKEIGKRIGYHMVLKIWKNQKVIKIRKISENDDILTFEEN